MNEPDKEHLLSEETIQALIKLSEVVRRIHNRLVAEGKIKVVNGKIVEIKQENPPPD